MEHEFEHLSDAQIENYGDRTGAGPNQPDNDRAVEAHLSSCDACCARLLTFHRSRFGLIQGAASPTPECPSEDSLRALAAGLPIPADSAALMQHAAQCDHCGPMLRAYTEDFSDELSPADEALLNQLNSASPSWQNKIVRKMTEAASAQPVSPASATTSPAAIPEGSSSSIENRVAQPPSAVGVKTPGTSLFRLPRVKWLLVPAGAIACFLIAMFIWNTQRETPEKVEKLLAQAYTEQRTMEMRIPYAAHADFKQTRGDNNSLLNSPEALRKAADVIAANLKKNPDDPQWLLLSARLDLLDWRYKSALSTLSKIDDEKIEDSAEFRLTESLALYQKAEIEHDPQSYGEVVDLLGRTLQTSPEDPVALFNQAVACEKLYMYECATQNYERFLKVDPHSGWSNEAREHLNRIHEKKTPGGSSSVIFSTLPPFPSTSAAGH